MRNRSLHYFFLSFFFDERPVKRNPGRSRISFARERAQIAAQSPHPSRRGSDPYFLDRCESAGFITSGNRRTSLLRCLAALRNRAKHLAQREASISLSSLPLYLVAEFARRASRFFTAIGNEVAKVALRKAAGFCLTDFSSNGWERSRGPSGRNGNLSDRFFSPFTLRCPPRALPLRVICATKFRIRPRRLSFISRLEPGEIMRYQREAGCTRGGGLFPAYLHPSR
ncbi:hypothetical protein PUN28_018951 [Cardiocondyla obscurior]|uniref:Uncharacterized protein n=1 Tax=Cardiocondyla obscurior TaxID=286306 RepID=A0AAW2EGK3_9HYME